MSNWVSTLQSIERIGEIEQCIGLKYIANGPPQTFVGELCEILDCQDQLITLAEVIGFSGHKVFLMPYSKIPVRMGYKVKALNQGFTIGVCPTLLGRIVDAFAKPLDQPFFSVKTQQAISRQAINPLLREPIHERLHTGIHVIDTLFPLGKGQRIGLFAGSGVGKSVLLGMLAKYLNSDINIIALIGERGREVHDFITNHLDQTTMAKTVIVAACSDDTALMRKQAAYTATTLAEYFCEQGNDVVLFMDSITRLAMAQREISLSLGEPPTARGYTPSVFSMLPSLVERTGNFRQQGSISAIYTVLVEGDDFNEPVADTMRSLLDGHIVLTRELAHRNHYPAIDVLQSLSRLCKQLQSEEEQQLGATILGVFDQYYQNKDLIELGAYQAGKNKLLDHALQHIEPLIELFKQKMNESIPFPRLQQQLKEIMA